MVSSSRSYYWTSLFVLSGSSCAEAPSLTAFICPLLLLRLHMEIHGHCLQAGHWSHKSGTRVPEVFSLGVQVSIDIRFIGEQALTAWSMDGRTCLQSTQVVPDVHVNTYNLVPTLIVPAAHLGTQKMPSTIARQHQHKHWPARSQVPGEPASFQRAHNR